jgi:hypothetical protein
MVKIMRLFSTTETSPISARTASELTTADEAFMHKFTLYPKLNATVNERVSEICMEADDMAWGTAIPYLPESYRDLQFGLKKLLFLFTDPYHPEDTISIQDVAMLCATLIEFTDNDRQRLSPALHVFVYNASKIYTERLTRRMSFWHIIPNHDRLWAIIGATYTDEVSLLQIPQPRRGD